MCVGWSTEGCGCAVGRNKGRGLALAMLNGMHAMCVALAMLAGLHAMCVAGAVLRCWMVGACNKGFWLGAGGLAVGDWIG